MEFCLQIVSKEQQALHRSGDAIRSNRLQWRRSEDAEYGLKVEANQLHSVL